MQACMCVSHYRQPGAPYKSSCLLLYNVHSCTYVRTKLVSVPKCGLCPPILSTHLLKTMPVAIKSYACMHKLVCPVYDNMLRNQSEKDSLKSK